MTHHNPLRRMLDQMPPDLGEATVTLIDALRDYVRSIESDEDEWQFDNEKARRGHMRHIQTCKLLLTDLEGWEVDMTLHGIMPGTSWS